MYAEYEQQWRDALAGDLADVDLTTAEIDEIVESQVATLPSHDELETLRSMYAVVALFLHDAPWPRAFDAADRAIAECGEQARRPLQASAR